MLLRTPRALICLPLLTALGCADRPSEPPPATPAPAAEAPAAPAGPTVEERRARYDARPTVTLPADVPGSWGRFVDALEGRLVEVRHALRSHSGPADRRSVELEVRVFDLDDAVRARVHAALADLKLPGLPSLKRAGDDFWRGEPIVDGPVRWSIDIGRLVAPPGEPREQIVTLKWRRAPADPLKLNDCRKPRPVPAPAGTPAWLERTTKKRTTRRRVTAEVRRAAEGEVIEMRMLFHNGLAHDEHLRHLAEAAAGAGFTRESGEGTRQRWTKGAARFEFAPDTAGDLKLGCTLAGPVLRLTLSRPAAAP